MPEIEDSMGRTHLPPIGSTIRPHPDPAGVEATKQPGIDEVAAGEARAALPLDRREFLKAAGCGLFTLLRVGDLAADHYDVTRFSDVPEIDTVLIDNPELAPQGCGEPTITCVAPMLANALFDATGRRAFRLPLNGSGGTSQLGR